MYTVLNPHLSDFFATPLSFLVFKRRSLKKYEYIIKNEALPAGAISFLFDGLASSLIPDKYFSILPLFIKKMIIRLEIKKWKSVNKVSPLVNCYYHVKDIPKPNVLFFLCYRNYKQSQSLLAISAHFKHCVAHLTHYYAFPKQYSAAIKNIPNIHIAADADVSTNAFFKEYFSWYSKPILLIPFAISDRFTITKPFTERVDKAIATGTFHKLEIDVQANDPNCFEIKKLSNTIHPMRRWLYEQKDALSNHIDVFCKPFYEKNDSSTKGANKMLATQSAYFSFDIVAKYNQFKYAVIGEESIVGLPGIGSFEAMACGCVLIANEHCYQGTGAIAGQHYLPYQNSIAELTSIITSDVPVSTLQTISQQAHALVNSTMRPAILQQKLYSNFKNL